MIGANGKLIPLSIPVTSFSLTRLYHGITESRNHGITATHDLIFMPQTMKSLERYFMANHKTGFSRTIMV
ncbi:MAG: hypothetical protein ABW115_20015, partial [Candidatus Thiodiazotropha sp. 6PLUC6]